MFEYNKLLEFFHDYDSQVVNTESLNQFVNKNNTLLLKNGREEMSLIRVVHALQRALAGVPSSEVVETSEIDTRGL